MPTNIRVQTNHGDERVVHAIKEDRRDQSQYLIEFFPNGSKDKVAETILTSGGLNNPKMVSYVVTLKRGLYDVKTSRIIMNASENGFEIDESSVVYHSEPVMVGNPYRVKIMIENQSCYDLQGVRVQILSEEIPLDSKTVYYQIKKENLDHIKYYVPFNNQRTIEFFVQGVREDEIALYFGTPSFQIEKSIV